MDSSISVAIIKCPGCMAPLTPPAKGEHLVVCEYCQNSYTIQEAENETQKLRADVKKWISDIAGQSGSGGVDEASRNYIFKNNLFPPIRLAVERATEIYQPVRYLPILSFPLIDLIPRNPFQEALEYSPDVKDLTQSLKTAVSQIQAPELSPFARGDAEKLQLKYQEVSCLELTYLSNMRHGIANYSENGFEQSLVNLKAVEELYLSTIGLITENDGSKVFLTALLQRLAAVEEGVTVLSALWKKSDGIIVDSFIQRLKKAADDCEKAASMIESSGREPKDSVPTAAGTRDDATVLKILGACVSIFRDTGCAESGIPFESFLQMLCDIISGAIPASANIEWLEDYIENLSRYLGAMDGTAEVPVINDFAWVKSVSEAGIKSSLFSGKETISSVDHLFMPCWIAAIHFSEQSGSFFWKKGQGCAGYMYCEAGRFEGACFIESENTDLAAGTIKALESPQSLAVNTKVIAPIVGEDDALRWMKKTLSATEQFSGSHIKIIDLAYVLAALVTYANKKNERKSCIIPSQNADIEISDFAEVIIGNRQILTIA